MDERERGTQHARTESVLHYVEPNAGQPATESAGGVRVQTHTRATAAQSDRRVGDFSDVMSCPRWISHIDMAGSFFRFFLRKYLKIDRTK